MPLLPNEGLGSIPRPLSLITALKSDDQILIEREKATALQDTIKRLSEISLGDAATLTDGEQVLLFDCYLLH